MGNKKNDMTAKEYLLQISRYDRRIQNKLTELFQLKQMATGISVCTDSDNVQSSHKKDKLGDTVSKIVDLEREIDEIIDELYDKKKVIIRQLEEMEDTDFYHVLFNRYVAHKSLMEISNEMECSYRHITTIHGEALKKFENSYLMKK